MSIREPKRPRDGWKMPDPPEEGDYEPVASMEFNEYMPTGEGWMLAWYSDTAADRWVEMDDDAWPFGEDEGAGAEDLEAIGFRCEDTRERE